MPTAYQKLLKKRKEETEKKSNNSQNINRKERYVKNDEKEKSR